MTAFLGKMRTKTTLLLITLILNFSLPAHASNPACQFQLLGGTPISEIALQALHNAKNDYEIEVVTKVINGKPRAIILAGETHIKKAKASDIGVDLLKEFKFRGLEGADPSKNGIAGKLFTPLMSAMHFIARKVLRLKGSTIHDASYHEVLEITKNEYAAKLAERIKKEFGQDIVFLNKEQEATLLKILSKVALSAEDGSTKLTIKAEDIVAAVKKYLQIKNIDTSLDAPVNVQLEDGHKPGIAENLDLLTVPIIFGLVGLNYGLSHFSGQGNAVIDIANSVVTALNYFQSGYVITSMILKKKFSQTKWFNTVFPLENGIITGRNETMVGNIEKGFEERPEFDQMLVIVGSNHVVGMKKLLIDNFGYNTTKVPNLPEKQEPTTVDITVP